MRTNRHCTQAQAVVPGDDLNDLVRRCQGGEAAAWEELVNRYSWRVHGMCRRYAHNKADAGDLAQEVFLKIFRALGSVRTEKFSFESWLSVVTRNLLTDHYRCSRHERQVVSIEDYQVPLQREAKVSERPDALFARSEKRRLVRKALNRLPGELKESILLHHVQELQQNDIARRMGVPDGTVKSRLNRGRTAMARMLSVYRLAA